MFMSVNTYMTSGEEIVERRQQTKKIVMIPMSHTEVGQEVEYVIIIGRSSTYTVQFL